MKCSRALDLFSSYAAGELEPEQSVAFEAHLADCADCHSAYQRFNAAIMALEEMPEVEVPTGFHEAVMARVQESRRWAANPVRWWQLDWQRVFTIRVQARVAALAAVAVLIAIGIMRLTPVNGVVAGLFSGYGSVGNVVTSGSGEVPTRTPMPYGFGPTIASFEPSGAKLKITVQVPPSASGRSSYTLRLDATSAKPVSYSVERLRTGTSRELISAGAVAGDRGAVTVVNSEGRPTIVKVAWKSDGVDRSETLFLPAAYNSTGAKRSVNASISTSFYDALSEISAKSGMIIVGSDNLNKQVALPKGETAEQTLRDGAAQAGLQSRILASSIYIVNQAGH